MEEREDAKIVRYVVSHEEAEEVVEYEAAKKRESEEIADSYSINMLLTLHFQGICNVCQMILFSVMCNL